MGKRLLLAGLLGLGVLFAIGAGGWNELGGGALLTTSDEWGVERLEVDAGSFDFEYHGGSGPATRIEVYGAADERPVLARDGSLLSITLAERMRIGPALPGRIVVYGPAIIELAVNSESGSIVLQTIATPRLMARSGSGSIAVESVEAEIELYTVTGDVTVVDATGDKQIVTDAGDIAVSSSSGGMYLRSSTGRVSLWNVTGALDVETVSGAIDVVGLTLRDSGRVVTEGGRIEVIFAHELDELSLDLTSETGKIFVGEEPWPADVLIMGESEDAAEGHLPFVGISGSGQQYYR